jgi:hypothetical protein
VFGQDLLEQGHAPIPFSDISPVGLAATIADSGKMTTEVVLSLIPVLVKNKIHRKINGFVAIPQFLSMV